MGKPKGRVGKSYRIMWDQNAGLECFYPEYRIGPDLGPGMREDLRHLQNHAHPEVRRLRLETAVEACERYDVTGFEYDFMRCPLYFKHSEVGRHVPLMTEFVRQTRAALDAVGKRKGRPIGLSVRVPNTVAGARKLGLDVPAWIGEELVDIVVPSTFFNADLEEDIREWVRLAAGTPVRINPAIEEAYTAGHTGGVNRCFYSPPVMLPLSHEMVNAIAARHWRNGADGLYVFNWFGTAAAYGYDINAALDEEATSIHLDVADDLAAIPTGHGWNRRDTSPGLDCVRANKEGEVTCPSMPRPSRCPRNIWQP